MIAVIRVRGTNKIKSGIEATLRMLHLYNKNYAVLLEDTPQNRGMIQKAKDYVAYGSVDEATIQELFEKRGQEYTGRVADAKGKISYARRFIERAGKKYKKYFRLSPPRQGYGRKGIKRAFQKGGALGNRKERVNDLLKRMM